MAFDGLFCQAVAGELNGWAGARVEKIHQSAPSCMCFQIYKDGQHKNLVVSASASRPVVAVTDESVARPETPTPMCMLFRKHLQNGRIVFSDCPEGERIIRICIASSDEMGYVKNKFVIAEMMGKYSNLILTEEEGKVICATSVTDITSSGRRIMAGMAYEPPKKQDKTPIFVSDGEIRSLISAGVGCEGSGYLLRTFLGLSPLVAREVTFCATGSTDTVIQAENADAFVRGVTALRERVKNADFVPCAVNDKDGRGVEYSFMPITQYGKGFETRNYDSLSLLLTEFFDKKEEAVNIDRYSHAMVQSVNIHISRLRKKQQIFQKELEECEGMEKMRIYGDIITANIYRIKQGDTSVLGMDYESGMEVEVKLEPNLTPAKNAQKYYKKYAKMKRARAAVTQQAEKAGAEEHYLLGVLDFISRAGSPTELAEIKAELAEGGFVNDGKKGRQNQKQKKKTPVSKPLSFTTRSGLTVKVGRNNKQNDLLTASASKNDLWFHIKGFHGSHVVLFVDGKEPEDSDYTDSAALAAYFSEKRGSKNVEVDYTRIRHLKKPNGSAPGFVTYEKYWSAVVDAVNPFEER